MQSIRALSFTPRVNTWLADSRDPHILHIFDRACNLINERREVVSVVTPQFGNGPFNLVVEDMLCFSEHLDIHSSVSISQSKLTIDDLTIHTPDAQLWNPQPDWEMLHANRNQILDQLTQLLITNDQVPNSLSYSLVRADLPSSLIAAKAFAGLGVGLTPAGDDFIMGALYAAWIIHPCEVAGSLAQSIADVAAPLTTTLSAACLHAGAKGEAGILWHEFFEALVSAEDPRIQQSMDRILAVGETSGSDALAGFLSTMTAWHAL